MNALALPLALVLGVAAAAANEPAPGPGPERWLWNARERTATALRALGAGESDRAVEALEAAARVQPDDPLVRYNAGAGRLAALPAGPGGEAAEARADAARAAIPHLEAAVETAPADLAPDAFYDLGTAHLAAGEPGPAVAALSEALRRASTRPDAKHNLELARRALEEERQKQLLQQQRQEQGQGQPQPPQPQPQQRDRDEGGPEPREDRGDQGSGEDPARPEGEPAKPEDGQDGPRQDRNAPLRDFVDQPDMNAREAAALLEAVENRERQQRREAAAARARQSSREEKDW